MATDQNLEQAFRTTTFRIDARRVIRLRIGARSRAMDALLRRHHTRTATFVTAYNPFGHVQSRVRNRSAQKKLEAEVRRLGRESIGGSGVPDDPRWSPEPSVLVFGLSRAQADRLAAKFRQAAHVWIESRKVPVLAWPQRGR